MMYGGEFPDIKDDERLARAEALDIRNVRLSVADAWRKLGAQGTPDEAVLAMQDSRPVYRFHSGRRQWTIYADAGDGGGLNPESFARTASSWSGLKAGEATAEVLTEPDQWTVQSLYSGLRPMTKFTWPDGEEVYVSHVTGEVVQATTRRSRLLAYCGAVMHWLYFLPMTKNGQPR